MMLVSRYPLCRLTTPLASGSRGLSTITYPGRAPEALERVREVRPPTVAGDEGSFLVIDPGPRHGAEGEETGEVPRQNVARLTQGTVWPTILRE